MKILLFGEYSNLHATLAKGLRTLGHDVLVISDGTRWRNYERDIDLSRNSHTLRDKLRYTAKLITLLPKMRGFDVVQLINPDCFKLKAERQYYFFNYLKRHNRKVFSGAFGTDWYWVDAGLHLRQFRYGDFYIGDRKRLDEAPVQKYIEEWIGTPKGTYSQYVNRHCDGIPACLYEYYACYSHYFPEKTRFLPLPIIPEHTAPVTPYQGYPIRFFIGIDTRRAQYKGTDIMLQALKAIRQAYPTQCEIVKAEHLPFDQYQQLMDSCHCVLDQLYSYTPAMNALQAMEKGLVNIGGGEPESYDILHEHELHPIINVEPTFESVYHQLEQLILHPERIPQLQQQSIEYIRRHHDYRRIAQQYVDFYNDMPAE